MVKVKRGAIDSVGAKRVVLDTLEAKIAALRAEFDVESEELHLMAEEEQERQAVLAEDRLDMAHLRKGKPIAARQNIRKKSETSQ